METGLEGKSVVVTGAGAGIGRATAALFSAEGARVVGGDLDVSGLEGAESVGRVEGFEVDLSSRDGCESLVAHAVEVNGTVDCLVNNVGIANPRESFLEITDEDWDWTFTVNFKSMVRCSRAALPHMVAQGKGSIVCLGSEVARQPDVFLADYSVSKAAVLSLAKIISMEFGAHGVRANAVSPGPTRTELWEKPGGFTDYLAKEFGMGREEAIDHFAKVVRNLPLGRIGAPEDVAAAIVFLSSDLAKQVTGSEYAVDSGVKKAV